MLNTFPIALVVSTALGFLAGIGVGGGSLLVLWLTLVLNVEPDAVRSMNLLLFLPTACISSFFRWRQGSLNLQKILPAILAGCASASIFSFLSKYISTELLQKFFGVLLLATGIRELLYKPQD